MPGGIVDKEEKIGYYQMAPSLLWMACWQWSLVACGTTTAEAPAAPGAAEECTEPDVVRLQLQWFAQSQFAGYYVAQDKGFYEDQCLDVTILEGAVEIVPQQVLATGGAEFGLAWVPKALVSREGGADIVNIAQVFERSGTLKVSWADSGITEPADWAGKKVGQLGLRQRVRADRGDQQVRSWKTWSWLDRTSP